MGRPGTAAFWGLGVGLDWSWGASGAGSGALSLGETSHHCLPNTIVYFYIISHGQSRHFAIRTKNNDVWLAMLASFARRI